MYGGNKLPLTGSAIFIGGTAVAIPKVAAIGAGIILIGFVIMRLARPARMEGITPGRPGRSFHRIWRRGRI